MSLVSRKKFSVAVRQKMVVVSEMDWRDKMDLGDKRERWHKGMEKLEKSNLQKWCSHKAKEMMLIEQEDWNSNWEDNIAVDAEMEVERKMFPVKDTKME